MASKPQNILVFGGTGVIGKYITNALINSKSAFGKIALFTSPASVESKAGLLEQWKGQGVEVIVGDLTNEDEVLNAYKGFDTIVSALGRNVIAEQINLIRLANVLPSMKWFFPSEYGTDIEYYPHSVDEKPHQQKLKVRAYIKDNVKRLNICYLVTGPYADLYMGKSATGAGTFDVQGKTATLLGTGDEKISLTAMEDVGKLLVAALQHPEQVSHRALKVNSFTTTPREILAEYERQTGEKWMVEYLSLPDLKEAEKAAWAVGNPAATGVTLRRIWTEGGTLYEKRDNAVIGDPEMDTMSNIVAQQIEKQV